MNNLTHICTNKKYKTMEDQKQSFKLIDSTYSPEDSREVLSRLVKDKVKFLTQEIFSMQVRYGTDTTHLENRKSELCKLEEELLKPLLSIDNDDNEVVIDCQVNFTIRKKEKNNESKKNNNIVADIL